MAEILFATTKMGNSCKLVASKRGRAGFWCRSERVLVHQETALPRLGGFCAMHATFYKYTLSPCDGPG
jgi:hypothetical protein